jgi:hypothetical protein
LARDRDDQRRRLAEPDVDLAARPETGTLFVPYCVQWAVSSTFVSGIAHGPGFWPSPFGSTTQ